MSDRSVDGRFRKKSKLGRLPFGKYNGMRITDIAMTDPKYLYWLLEQEWLQKQKFLCILICRALDINETLLPHAPAALTTLRRYSRQIVNDVEPKEKL